MYYRANVVIVVHDNSRDSISSARTYIKEMEETWKNDGMVLCLCQNKRDLDHASFNEDLAAEPGVALCGFVSAKTGKGVAELVEKACGMFIKYKMTQEELSGEPEAVNLEPGPVGKQRDWCCST